MYYCSVLIKRNKYIGKKTPSKLINTTADLNLGIPKSGFWSSVSLFLSLQLAVCLEISLARGTDGHSILCHLCNIWQTLPVPLFENEIVQ